ncbi:MAG: response regulator transcription factor [Patescibacteria group bacterium]
MKILIAEDDKLLSEFMRLCLNKAGMTSHTTNNGSEALRLLQKNHYDVAVLDIEMPGDNGLAVCRKVRKQKIATPIIIVSSRVSHKDRVDGLGAGADDYLVKPFNHEELVARIKALNRRPPGIVQEKIQVGELVLEISSQGAMYGGLRLNLTPLEFRLLEYLVRHKEKVVKREHLLQVIWGVEVGNTSNRLESCIRNLRRKIVQAGGDSIIKTKHGVGYMIAGIHK